MHNVNSNMYSTFKKSTGMLYRRKCYGSYSDHLNIKRSFLLMNLYIIFIKQKQFSQFFLKNIPVIFIQKMAERLLQNLAPCISFVFFSPQERVGHLK